jgi:ATP-binding cassette subfamily C protein
VKAFLLKYKKEFVIVVFFAILAALMNVFVAFILKMFFDVATIGRLENFYTAVEIALVFVIFNSLVLWLAQISKFDYIKKSLIHLKNVLFEKIIGKDLNQFDEVNTGKYISIVSNDINMIEENYFNNFFELVSSGVGFLAALIVLFILSYKITFIIIGLTVLSMLIPRVLDRKISDLR